MKQTPVIVTIGVLIALATAVVTVLYGDAHRPTASNVADRATYYRLRVNVEYRAEPVLLDVVVGCNARTTLYKDGDRSVELGLVPFAFGLRMQDGRALVVQPPTACGGETTDNGRVPPDLLPLLIIYDDAGSPTEGTGYASLDAYNRPGSILKFNAATISRATRNEFDDWRQREAPRNIVRPEMIPFTIGAPFVPSSWSPGTPLFGSECRGVLRVPLPERLREEVRRHRPENLPAFWVPSGPVNSRILSVASDTSLHDTVSIGGLSLSAFSGSGLGVYGLPTPRGGGMIAYSYPDLEIYPVLTDLSLTNLTRDGQAEPALVKKDRLIESNAIISPGTLGLVRCFPTYEPTNGKAAKIRRPGAPVDFLVNGELVDDPPPRDLGPGMATYSYFENDTHSHRGLRFP